MTVNGQVYNFSEAAPWMPRASVYGNNKHIDEPIASDAGTYALDINGDIFAYNRNSAEANANTNYGYLIAYDAGGSLFGQNLEDLSLRILSQNGTRTDYYVRRSTRINGKAFSNIDEFLNALYSGASYQYAGTSEGTDIQQVIKYVATGNMITDIYTVSADTNINSGHEIVSNELYKYNRLDPRSGDVNVTYSGYRLSNGSANITVESGTIVFVVPEDSKRSDQDSFFKRDRGYFSNNRTYSKVEAFDVSTANSARVVVVYGGASAQEVDDNSPIMVVSERPGQTYENGEYVYDLTGFEVTRSSARERNRRISDTSNGMANSIEIGDIYRIGEDSYGYATFENKNRLYPSSQGYVDTGVDPISRWYTADYCVIYGSVYASNSNDGMVIVPTIANGENLDDETQYTLSALSFDRATILRYDNTGSYLKVNDVTADGLVTLDTISSYVTYSNPAKVLVYLYQGEVKLLAIVQE